MLLSLLACVRRVFLVHLLQFCVVLGLLGLQVELHVLQLLQVFVFNFFSKSLFLSSDFFCLSAVFLLYSIDHVVQFLEVVMVSLLHLLPFREILLLENVDVSSELLHEALDA